MKQTIKCFIAAFAAMLMSVAAYAQVTTSALAGRAIDKNGQPVPGVAVIATHTPSGTVYGVSTNEAGRYTINGMRSGGPYKVEFSCLGYQTVAYTDLTLQLAETSALNATLNEDSEMLGEAMVIAAAESKFAAQKTGAATNISNAQIANLPTVSRSITDVTRLSAYGGHGMTFAGSDGRTANFTVDGANFNNNFGLNESLPGGGNPISIDAIEEMQIVISPFDVRQTNFVGGGINAITKSGTNTFKGSAYIYHRNENLRGDTIYGEQITSARDKDRHTTYGVTLGGPIIKNKLFFFVNAEMSKIPTVVNRWRPSNADPELANAALMMNPGVMDPDNFVSRTSAEDLAAVSEHVKIKYGYNTGSYTSYPADEANYKILARLDWNITDNHHLALRYNYTLNQGWNSTNSSSMDGGVRSSTGRLSKNAMAFANSLYSMDNLVHTVALDLNSRFSENLSNQFLATFSKLDDVRGSTSDEFPFVDIMDGGSDTYMALGYELFTWNNGVHNTVFTVKDDLTYYAGNHKITAGLNYEYQMADNAYMRNGTGYYRYDSMYDFLKGEAPSVVCLTYGYDNSEDPANPAARVRYHKAGIYGQDEWSVNDNFKLTYGLRIDALLFDNKDLMTNKAIYDLDYNGRHIDTGKWPNTSLTFSPRVGFNWDILEDRSLTLRGGTGLFSGRLPLVFFTNMPTNSGMVQYQAKLNATGSNGGTKTNMDVFKNGLVTDASGKATIAALRDKLIGLGYPAEIHPEDGTIPSEISGVDPKFKMPQVWKTSLALDYKVPVSFPFTVSVEGIFNKTVNGVVIQDWSIRPVESFTKFNGPDKRPVYPSNQKYTYTTSKTYYDAEGNEKVITSEKNLPNAYMLANTNRGYGYIGTFTVNMRPIEALSLMAAYTHTASYELTGMPGNNASSVLNYIATVEGPIRPRLQTSEYVTPDRLVASATIHDKSNNTFSFIYEAFTGGRYSYETVNDMNGDGYNYDSIYIPTDAQVANNEFRFVGGPEGDNATRFMDYLHNDKYLSKNQGKYSEAYSVYAPWIHKLDFRYTHDFKIKAGKSMNTLQLSLDIKNILNIFNSSWGVSKYMNPAIQSDGAVRVLKYEGMDADGYPTFSTPEAIKPGLEKWIPSHTLGQCWSAQIGIKYMFN